MQQNDMRRSAQASDFANRLSWSIPEFARLNGWSMPTIRRRITDGHIKVTRIGPTRRITRAEAIRLGLATE